MSWKNVFSYLYLRSCLTRNGAYIFIFDVTRVTSRVPYSHV